MEGLHGMADEDKFDDAMPNWTGTDDSDNEHDAAGPAPLKTTPQKTPPQKTPEASDSDDEVQITGWREEAPKPKVTCRQCGKQLANENELQLHCTLKHPGGAP